MNKNEVRNFVYNGFYACLLIVILILLLAFMGLFIPSAKGAYIPIPRNRAWNDLVHTLRAQLPQIKRIEGFLKRNERYPRVKELDARVLIELDTALKNNQRIAKDLKKIRQAISTDYQGGAP